VLNCHAFDSALVDIRGFSNLSQISQVLWLVTMRLRMFVVLGRVHVALDRIERASLGLDAQAVGFPHQLVLPLALLHASPAVRLVADGNDRARLGPLTLQQLPRHFVRAARHLLVGVRNVGVGQIPSTLKPLDEPVHRCAGVGEQRPARFAVRLFATDQDGFKLVEPGIGPFGSVDTAELIGDALEEWARAGGVLP